MSGHLPNGNPVQRHSAGEIYPCVIYRREKKDGPKWGVLGPRCGNGVGGFASYADAAEFARYVLAGN